MGISNENLWAIVVMLLGTGIVFIGATLHQTDSIWMGIALIVIAFVIAVYAQLRQRFSGKEWETLQAEFEKCKHPVVAFWERPLAIPTPQTWRWRVEGDDLETQKVEILMAKAGNFLLRSRWPLKEYPLIANEAQPVFRWLSYIYEVQGQPGTTQSSGISAGVRHVGGRVEKVEKLSALVCGKLAIAETLPKHSH